MKPTPLTDAEWHKARISLEGNPVFQAMRLELDTLREERAELIEALRNLLQEQENRSRVIDPLSRCVEARAILSRLEADK